MIIIVVSVCYAGLPFKLIMVRKSAHCTARKLNRVGWNERYQERTHVHAFLVPHNDFAVERSFEKGLRMRMVRAVYIHHYVY